jgi:hypothetical protein
MAPVMMAKEGGYFAEQGLDVDLRKINGSTVGMASLLSGELQVLQASANVVVTSAAEGAKLRVISGFVNQSTLLAMTAHWHAVSSDEHGCMFVTKHCANFGVVTKEPARSNLCC